MQLNSIEEIIEDVRAGKMVIIMDDEDRENEGDLVMASDHVRPEDINFMARYGRGLICLTLTREQCERLRLPLMVSDNREQYGTNFTVSIEAAAGVTTGISATDRAVTVAAASSPDARPEDIIQPGHIFPLMAQAGGVLTRAGHTETGCDLARLAGCSPSGVIVEILNEDGSMARRPDLEIFAKEHDLKIGTVADLIEYRSRTDHAVERLVESKVETEFGEFTLTSFEDTIDQTVHLALTKGDISPEEETLVRVHVRHTLSDVLGVQDSAFGLPVRKALKELAKADRAALVLLRKPEESRELINQIQSLARGGVQSQNDTEQKHSSPQLRTFGVGAQILRDLGVRKMRIISAPYKMQAISGFGLEVTGYAEPTGD
ncbi:MAG: 3,4-dihydroxy 2-butanone 4-phosphate synthase/GTP cyclohydrolase II [Gammaproteobacteria bacterium]|jgi:3,4-dihydroxy 2-butanone 4-phosphate synthase/GTP cyclohydrolase II